MSLAKKNNIEDYLSQNKEWQYQINCISRTCSFNTYMDSINFVVSLAEIAEQQNHHPDLSIGWCSVKVQFTSHDQGGVTEQCLLMSRLTEELYR